jgi:hypothetical protein
MDPQIEALFSAALTATKASNALLKSDDISTFPGWSREIGESNETTTALINEILELVTTDNTCNDLSHVDIADLVSAFLDQADIALKVEHKKMAVPVIATTLVLASKHNLDTAGSRSALQVNKSLLSKIAHLATPIAEISSSTRSQDVDNNHEMFEFCSEAIRIIQSQSAATFSSRSRRGARIQKPFVFTPSTSACCTMEALRISPRFVPEVDSLTQNIAHPTDVRVQSSEHLFLSAGWLTIGKPKDSASMLQDLAENPLLALVGARFAASVDSLEPANDRVSVQSSPQTNECLDDDQLTMELPRSMSDIYKISNKNRRKNKDKKKGREADFEEAQKTESQFDYFAAEKRPKTASGMVDAPTLDFLAEVGWSIGAESAHQRDSVLQIGHFEQPATTNPYISAK